MDSKADTEQFNVYHIGGDLNNCLPNNLKTVCANCQRYAETKRSLRETGPNT